MHLFESCVVYFIITFWHFQKAFWTRTAARSCTALIAMPEVPPWWCPYRIWPKQMYSRELEPPMGETLHSRTALRSTLVSRCISGAGVCLSAVLTGALILRAQHSGLRQRIVMARIILLIQLNLLQDSVMPFCKTFRLQIISLTLARTHTVARGRDEWAAYLFTHRRQGLSP